MAESETVDNSGYRKKPRRVGYLKMKVIENLKSDTINEQVHRLAKDATSIDTDNSTSYVDLKNFVPEFLQKYLDEFNRRYFGEALFGRLLFACVSYKNAFRYIWVIILSKNT